MKDEISNPFIKVLIVINVLERGKLFDKFLCNVWHLRTYFEENILKNIKLRFYECNVVMVVLNVLEGSMKLHSNHSIKDSNK